MRAGFIACAIGLAIASPGQAAPAVSALDKPAFTATPAELLALAKAAPTGDGGVTALLEDNDASFDDRGRMTYRWRMIFAVRTQEGADGWDSLTTDWSPSFQDKPTVRVRVIDSGGRVVHMSASQVTEEPPDAAKPDRRTISAALPRLTVGSVVEEEVVTVDREAMTGGGQAFDASVTPRTIGDTTHIELSVPAKRGVHHVERNVPASVKAKHDVSNGRETWKYVFPPRTPDEPLETDVPGDVIQATHVRISTSPSWSSVARDTRAMLDKRIADGAVPFPAELTKAATRDAARAILAWVHQRVKYEGAELDNASLVPATPADVLAGGEGSDLELATLTVSLLRQAGLRAEVVLIDPGPGIDAEVDVPSLSWLTHAIVRAHGTGFDAWIDLEEPLFDIGELPARDQNRRALVISDDTKGFVTTPYATPADNKIREVRTFELQEAGFARVSEVSHEGGAFSSDQRAYVRDHAKDELQKNFEKYVEHTYGSATVDSFTSTPPEDLSRPFELTLAMKKTKRASTSHDQIGIYLTPADTFVRLPSVLSEDDDAHKARKRDFQWSQPQLYEIENRLVVPIGYSLPAPDPEKVRELGTMKLTTRQRVDGRTFIVTFSLDTGKSRLTPAEVEETRAAIAEQRKDDVHLVIDSTSWGLQEKGKFKEAIADAQRVILLHPKEALHHYQFAELLLRMGAGEAARREAKKAVTLEPNNVECHLVLGWILTHDTLGRQWGFDHDHAAALAEYQKARKLDPKHYGVLSELAALLERDPKGHRFERGADMHAAAEAWKAARAIEDSAENGESLLRALLWAGEPGEAERVARAMESSATRDALLLAAIGMGPGGGDAALKEAAKLAASARRAAIDEAGSVLLMMRRYDAARVLLAQSTTFRAGSTQATLLSSLTRHDEPLAPAKGPESAALVVLVNLVRGNPLGGDVWDKTTGEELAKAWHKQTPTLLREGITIAWIEDMVRSSAKLKAEGEKGAWRVELDELGKKAWLYVGLDHGAYKVIGTSDAAAGVGRHVLRLLASGDEDSARRLLDWIAVDGTGMSHFGLTRLWGGTFTRDKEAAELAAAMLTEDTNLDRTIPIFKRCGATTTDGQAMCDGALADAYRTRGKWSDLLAFGEAWAARAPKGNTAALDYQARALTHLGRFDDADKLLEDAIAKQPDDIRMGADYADVAIAHGNLKEAVKRLSASAARRSSVGLVLNNLAWLELVEGSDLPTSLAHARDAVRQDTEDGFTLNTLATIEIETGDFKTGKDDGWRAMELSRAEKPDAADWYLIGRLFEQIGFKDDAVAVYKRVTPDKQTDFVPHAFDLAKRRLKALGAKK